MLHISCTPNSHVLLTFVPLSDPYAPLPSLSAGPTLILLISMPSGPTYTSPHPYCMYHSCCLHCQYVSHSHTPWGLRTICTPHPLLHHGVEVGVVHMPNPHSSYPWICYHCLAIMSTLSVGPPTACLFVKHLPIPSCAWRHIVCM